MDIAFAVTFLVINAKVLLITKMNNRIVGAETIGINSRIKVHFAFDNCLQSLSLNVFDNLGIDFSVSFVDTENDMFIFRSTPALTFFVARAKVRFIEFDFA
jgi:hypothetical protein